MHGNQKYLEPGRMRIDFGASFKDVSRLLRASAAPADRSIGAEFERNLHGIKSSERSAPDIASNHAAIQQRPRSEFTDTFDLRAGLRMSEPALELPASPPIAPESPVPERTEEIDPNGALGVKTPTLFEVRRVTLAEDVVKQNHVTVGRAEIRSMLQEVGMQMGVNPDLSMAVVKAESSFNPRAISSDGHASKGLFQLLDSTGKDLLTRGPSPDRTYDPFNPALNIELGTSYLKYLHDIFGTTTQLPNQLSTKAAADDASKEKFAVAAFNAGEGRVASAQRRAERQGKDPRVYENVESFLPQSTQQYVRRVINSKAL